VGALLAASTFLMVFDWLALIINAHEAEVGLLLPFVLVTIAALAQQVLQLLVELLLDLLFLF